MRRAVAALGIVMLGALAAPAAAIEDYLMSVAVLGGLGGPFDADEPDPGLDHQSLQLNVGLLTEPRTLVSLRLGQLDIDEPLGLLVEPTLDYLTVSGEYRFYKQWYDSGIFLGLGGYRLEGDGSDAETTLGFTAGVTGDLEITRWLSVVAELSAHWADLESSQFWGMGHAGLAVKF